jgi:hypothetical protein
MNMDMESRIYSFIRGVIVIAVAALLIYRAYFSTNTGLKASADINKVRGSIT